MSGKIVPGPMKVVCHYVEKISEAVTDRYKLRDGLGPVKINTAYIHTGYPETTNATEINKQS